MTAGASRVTARVRRGDFTLDVDVGWDERVAVIFGPSGSGKSTFFETVLGLHARAWPRVRLGGTWLDDPQRGVRTPIEERSIGWVPQDAALFPHLDVAGNLRFGLARRRRAQPGSRHRGARARRARRASGRSALRR
jgi:ABC-type molybdate transport system ATPase subunit